MGSLELQLGAAGSGKSVGIAQQIAAQVAENPLGERIFWIVPGVASYTTEQLLLEHVPGTLRAEVIHLQRLAARANGAVNCVSGKPVNQMGKRLLLASVFQDVQEQLAILGKAEATVSFLDAILDVFAEMSLFSISPPELKAQLETAAVNLSLGSQKEGPATAASLIGKLRDVCLLYVQWKQALTARDLYDPLDLPTLTGPFLRDWPELSGATLYIDGFIDIPPRDALFMMNLAASANKTVITLDMPFEWASAGYHSGTPQRQDSAIYRSQAWLSYRRVLTFADQFGLPVKLSQAPLAPEKGRFSVAPGLARLERCLRLDVPGKTKKTSFAVTEAMDTQKTVTLAVAQNIPTESDGVAQDIAENRLAGNLDFGSIAVLVPDIGIYGAILADSFEAYGIPYTADVYPPLVQHPLSKFVLSSLLSVSEDFSLTSVHRVLKSEFCGISSSDSDWFETYLVEYEVEGSAQWLSESPWNFRGRTMATSAPQRDERDDRAEKIRQKLLKWLAPLHRELSGNITPRDLARILWDLFKRVSLKRTIALWMANENESSNENAAEQSNLLNPLVGSLHEQAWMKWMAILDDLSETTLSRQFSKDFLLSLVFAECEGQSLTTIPASLGQVRILSYEHAVAWETERLYIMGATDSVLPKRVTHRGLLQDDERRQFFAFFGRRLGYTTAERQGFQRGLTYRMLTRARFRLTLSAPLSDTEGKALRSSLLFARLEEWLEKSVVHEVWTRDALFDLQEKQNTDLVRENPFLLFRPWMASSRSLASCIPMLRDGTVPEQLQPVLYGVLLQYLNIQDRRRALVMAVKGLAHRIKGDSLSSSLSARLYGEELTVSVNELESFAGCPYRHFAQYGLRLKPEQLPEVTPALRGTLMHDALQAFVGRQMEDTQAWRGFSDEQAVQAMESVFQEILNKPAAWSWMKKASRIQQAYEVLYLLRQAAVVLTKHLRHSRFSPVALEVSFGPEEDAALPALTVPLSKQRKVFLRGRIDRLDVANLNGNWVFRVFDYKSSERDLDLTRIEYGLRIQLPVYGVAAMESSRLWTRHPARLGAMFYLPVKTKIPLTLVPQEQREAQDLHVKTMRARGWMLADDELISAIDERISRGESDLFKKVYKQGGNFQKNAPVLSERHFDGLLARTLRHVQSLSERIQDGSIGVQPYRLGTETACDFCPYQSLCQKDKYDSGIFRKLMSVSPDQLDIWMEDTEFLRDVLTGGGKS